MNFCVNGGMTENTASQFQNVAVRDDLAYRLWAEPSPSSQTISEDEIILMLRNDEATLIATSLTVTCGKVQMQLIFEPTTFDLL